MTARSYGKSMFCSIRNCQIVLHSAYNILHSHKKWMRIPYCSTSLSIISVDSLLDFGPSNRSVVLSHCLNLYFPNGTWCGTSFRVLICHLYTYFSEKPIKVFGTFFNQNDFLMLNFKVSCIFYIVVLYQMYL